MVLSTVCFRCKLNCLSKANANQKLALVAACANCNVTKPIYSWEMFRKQESDNDFNHNDTETLKKYAVTDIRKDQNLVIEANALAEGSHIKLFCCAFFILVPFVL